MYPTKKTILVSLFVLANLLSHSQGYFEVDNLTAFDKVRNDRFGYSVDHDDDKVIFGAVNQDSDAAGMNILKNAGAAYIITTTGIVQKLVPSDRTAQDRFGFSVAIEGDYAVIGISSTVANPNRRAYVFKKNSSGVWEEDQILTVADASSFTLFGVAVAISNETIVVGDPGNLLDADGLDTLTGAGAAYVFELNGSDEWVETQKLVAANRFELAGFGNSVAIDDDKLVIGARKEEHDANDVNPLSASGAGYIFHRDGSNVWQQNQKIVASDRVKNQLFGHDVSISGNNIIVGATKEKRDADGLNPLKKAGAVYAYSYDASLDEWYEIQKITAQNRATGGMFGHSVDLNDDRFVASSPFGSMAGVELFLDSGLGDWSFSQKLVSSDFEASDVFGWDVSVTETFIMAGTILNTVPDDSGVDVNKAGSGYVFYNLPCSLPTIINVDVDVECATGISDISIDGNLNGATFWAVYTGDCGETLLTTSTANDFTLSIPAGTTAIFIRGEDGSGCINEDAGICFNISIGPIGDSAPPVAICQDITIYLDNSGSATIAAEDIDGGSYDDCGNVNMAAGPLTFDCGDIGDNTATLQIWDDSGNGNFCHATVTVEDTMNLVVACQDITISLDASGNASITEADIDGGTYDNCNEVFMAAAPTNFTTSNVGDNTVWLQVWTNYGEFGSCQANVHVINPFALVANNKIDRYGITPEKSIQENSLEVDAQLSERSAEVEIFPNPAVSEITIKGNSDYFIDGIRLLNSSLSTVKSIDFDLPTEERKINVEELPQGIYFVVITSGNATFVKKLIKI